MKKLFLYPTCLILLFSFAFFATKAQDNNVELPDNKQLILYTDRSIYVAGEYILFSAAVLNENNSENNFLSKVFYVEIITSDGEVVSNGKYPIKYGSGEGCLKIPNEILSGVYYIRAYTKYMRNYGPYSYYYIPLKIINPFINDIYGTTIKNGHDSVQYNTQEPDELHLFELATNKKEYNTREKVEITIKGTNIKKDSLRKVCLTVIPEGSLIEQNLIFPKEYHNHLPKDIYYPETRGTSLTGRLVNNEPEKPLGAAIANISIMEEKDFVPAKTDPTGRFYYYSPYYTGFREVFINSNIVDNIKSTILVDNDFCSGTIKLPSPIFNLSEKEAMIAYNLAMNSQINSYFNKKAISKLDTIKKYNTPFYGEPSETIYIDDYIELPTLSEFFYELIYNVTIKKSKGKRYFKVNGLNSEAMLYDPLVLLDYIAIDDPEKIMDINPSFVLKIDIINEYYVKGNITYGGIINVISKNGDFAGVDLPSSGIFIDYNFSTKCPCNLQKEYSAHCPDTRNTLFWNPDIILVSDYIYKLQFFTSDTPGKYAVVLRGINNKNETFINTSSFIVK